MARNSGGITLGSLKFVLGMDGLAFEQGADAAQKRMKQVQREFENTGKKLSGIGQTLSLGLTAPLAAFAAKGVNEARETAAAMGQVQAALQSMGPVAGRTSEQLAAMADNLEKTSTFEGDQILSKVTANLLTFGNVQGEVFDRAQQAAVNLSARLGTDLQGSAIQVGKALNDPIKGITALSRVGVSFTEQQKDQIKAMVAAGDAAGAQKLILAELEKQYGGAAQAAQDADPWNAMSDSINSMAESVGNILLPMMKPLADALERVATAFTSLSPETQKWVVITGGIAAAAGPVLIALGSIVGAIGTLLPLFVSTAPAVAATGAATAAAGTAAGAGAVGFGALATAILPIAALAAGAYLAWKNWDDIAPRIQPLIDQLTAIGEGLGLVEGKAGRTREELAKDDGFRKFGESLKGVSDQLQSWADAFDAYNARTAKAARENGTTIQAEVRRYWAAFDGFTQQLNGWGASVGAAIGNAASQARQMAGEFISVGRDMILGLVRGIRNNAGAVWEALGGVVKSGIAKAKSLLGIQSPSRVFMEIGDYIGQGLAVGMEGTRGRVAAAAKSMTEAARKAAQETATLLRRLYPELEQAEKYAADRKLISESGLSQGDKDRAALRLAAERDGFDRTARVEIKALEQGPIVNSEEITRQLGIFQRSMERAADGSEVQTVRIAKSFKDMTDEVIGSLRGLIDGIKKGDILSIVQGIAGVFQTLAGAGLFGKTVQGRVQNFKGFRALGGPVEAGGTYMVGERGPEFFTPKSSGFIHPNGSMPAAGALTLGISPSPLFHVYARDQAGRVVAESSPGIARSTASGIQSNWQAEGLRTLPG